MESSNNTNNVNFSIIDTDLSYRQNLKHSSDILAVVCLGMIMFAMGTDIKWQQVWNHVKRPIGVAIGMLCQFVVMPLIGFSLIQAFRLTGATALSVLLMSCCPGGAVSNMFCYFLDGDVPLSVTMTTLSSLMALGLMPFNFWLYGHAIDTGSLVVPYLNMIKSMAIITSPACAGMLIRWKFPAICNYLTKPLSLLSCVLIVASITLMILAYPTFFEKTTWQHVVVVSLMPIFGLVIGYCLAWVLRQVKEIRKTIAVECGVQNAAVAVAVLALSPFNFEVQGELAVFPMMYAISMITICIVGCIFYQLYKRCRSSDLDISKTNNSTPMELGNIKSEGAQFKKSTDHP